ncbi:MAG TPA: Hpt domain-containing protein [Myxococcota bacterium]|jgi:HPt (histidine-containing phosphotransfer) domain-containing protein
MGDSSGARPIFSALADDPALAPIIEAFVLGLAERIDAAQDAYSRRDLKELTSLAGALVSDAAAAGFEPLASCASVIEAACLGQQLEATYQGLIELTEIARCVRLGHRGAT